MQITPATVIGEFKGSKTSETVVAFRFRFDLGGRYRKATESVEGEKPDSKIRVVRHHLILHRSGA